jgi:hypothetical protein
MEVAMDWQFTPATNPGSSLQKVLKRTFLSD